jgi:hypothetical protein
LSLAQPPEPLALVVIVEHHPIGSLSLLLGNQRLCNVHHSFKGLVRPRQCCLRKKKNIDFALIDHITRAYIQEVQQVVDGKRVGCPNPDTGIQDIGAPDRVGCDLYSDWCKLRLAVQARVVTIFFSLQVTSLVIITVCIHFGLAGIAEVFLPVGIQLAVRKTFQAITLLVLIS